MTDYKNIQAPRPIERDFKHLEAFAVLAVIVLALTALSVAGNEDRKNAEVTAAAVREVAAVGIVYSQPAAFRLQSPTPEQMDKYHELMVIQEVRR